jgi:hypothetical protein
MRRTGDALVATLIVLALLLGCRTQSRTEVAPAPLAPKPLILRVPRPAGGEWLGLYLMGKKAGYSFSDVREGVFQGRKAVVATSTTTLKVAVGGAPATREVREERVYDYRDGGRLLAFTVEKRGDGGEETLIGACTPEGIRLLRKRPGLPDETRQLPATADVVELADAPRVAVATGKKVEGRTIDLEDSLQDKQVATELDGRSEYLVAGVQVPAARTRTVEEPQHIPTFTTLGADGRELEVRLGDVVGKAEDEATAKQLDKIDLFSLTRVVVDKPIAASVRGVPGQVQYVVRGLPEEFRRDTYRQKFSARPDGSTLLTVRAALPKASAERPVAAKDDEQRGALEATLAIESQAPAIIELADKVVGAEKDAYAAAKRINSFVNRFLQKAYGASSDRATDVLTAKKGDCTEHSLLMTALARAAGIPARRVDGLVYMEAGDGVPALYWHEWVEVWVGEWVAMDPTFDQFVADATHIALGRDLRSDTAGLIGQLKVSVVSP